MNDSVIPASSVTLRTMADGTLRVSVDIEPRHAQTAFVLFGTPGTPMALAALKVGTQTEPTPDPDPEPATEPAKGGPLAKWAAMRCQDERFLKHFMCETPETMRGLILFKCGIRSRAELDSSPEAAGLFAKHFRRPWHEHCLRNGWAD